MTSTETRSQRRPLILGTEPMLTSSRFCLVDPFLIPLCRGLPIRALIPARLAGRFVLRSGVESVSQG
jgi:hypothetical protein